MKTKIIYILGSGHSGSTLLDLILGSNSNIESGGEIRRFTKIIADKEFRDSRICTCGQRLSACPYWEPIFARIRAHGIDEQRFLGDPLTAQRDNAIFVGEVLRQSGKRVFADSTKSLRRLRILEKTQLFEISVLHLVRDGRAVAFSNMQKGRKFLEHLHYWTSSNSRILRYRKTWPGRWTTVHYERLVTAPGDEVRRIIDFVGENFEEGQMNFAAHTHHNLFGNRMRRSGNSEIVPDTKYLAQIGPLRWAISTAYAFPLLRKFNYPLSLSGAKKMLAGVRTG
jgi:hypothetical protein